MLAPTFRVTAAAPARFAASPQLHLTVEMTAAGVSVQGAFLRCLVHVALPRRAFDTEQEARLVELFGSPSRWGETAQTLLWTQAALSVPPFQDRATVEVPLPCTYDQHVASAKLLETLRDGDLPLTLSFSGTIFHTDDEGHLRAAPVPMTAQTTWRLPVAVYAETMRQYYPDAAPLCLGKDLYARLNSYRVRRGLASWDAVVERLLGAEEVVR